MPYLFCRKHGPDHEAGTSAMQAELHDLGESVLIVEGRLTSGGWRCDSCHAHLVKGRRAWLKTAFPAHLHDHLADYAFRYERDYFAMTPGDRVASYGTPWPDDSLRPERIAQSLAEERPPERRSMSAIELMAGIKD